MYFAVYISVYILYCKKKNIKKVMASLGPTSYLASVFTMCKRLDLKLFYSFAS